MLNDLLHRLRALFRKTAVEGELDDELRFHLQHETEKYVRSGLPSDEAARRARLSLGGLEQVKEECREARGVSLIETAAHDVRYAVRGMRRDLGFTVTAILTLGLGTGAVATVLTLANTLLFRELPVLNAGEVVDIQPTRRQGSMRGWISYPDYVHFRERTTSFKDIAAHYPTAPLFVQAAGRSQEINGAVVSANFFPLLGLSPSYGRFFRPDEDSVPDRDRVAVISFELWQSWFASSNDVLGGMIKINGVPFTVIGVGPRSFRSPNVAPVEVYIPTMMARTGYRWCTDSLARDCTTFNMIGRLAGGRTIEEARAEVAALGAALWAGAAEGENSGATVVFLRGSADNDRSRRSEVRFVTLLAEVAAVLLLICCANLAGLLMARNSARAREFAIRSSLGAGRGRLVRQLVTESLVLAVAGGALGVLLSLVLTGTIRSRFFAYDGSGRPLYYDFTLQPIVVLAALVMGAAAGLLMGLAPALRSIRGGEAGTLKLHATGTTVDPRAGRWLVAVQAAVAVALVGIATLLTANARALVGGAGFEASHIALMRLRPRLIHYPPEKAQRFQRAVIDRLSALPGVESMSIVGTGVVWLGGSASVALPESTEAPLERCGFIDAGARYFETMKIPVLLGREFDDRDTVNSPAVAIVNEALARRLRPGAGVIGQVLIVNGKSHRVVGLVKDVQRQPRGTSPSPYVYVPYWQNPNQVDSRVCIRVTGDPSAMLSTLAREVNRIDPDVPVSETVTLPLQLAGGIRSLRITASFVSYAAALAVLLSAIGVYSALAFSVSRRAKEIGIRLAVGAQQREVRAMVLREGMVVVLAGAVAGVGLAVASSRVVKHLLYGSGAADVYWYSAACAVVLAAGLLACWIPAIRATRVQPVDALRC